MITKSTKEHIMKLEDLQKVFKQKELRRLSCEALDRGDEELALVYYRAAKALNY
jgi:hypothetical protein